MPRFRSLKRVVVACGAPLVLVLVSTSMVACGPSDPLDEIRELHAARQFEASIEPLRNLLDQRGDDPEVNFLYGLALSMVGKSSLAQFPLHEAMKSPEWLVRAGLQLASGSIHTGNAATGVEALGRVLEVEPENTLALVLRAYARANEIRDYEGALADADRALEIDPDYVDALIPRALAFLGLEQVEEAAVALAELERRFSNETLGLASTPRYCGARAMFAREKGEVETADERYTGCLEKFPASILLIDSATSFYDELGRFDRSTEILRRGLEEAPLERQIRLALVLRLPYEEAVEILQAATTGTDPRLAGSAWADLGGYYVQQGDLARGVEAFEKSVAMIEDPSPELVFTFADALVVAQRYDRALALAETMTVPSHRELVFGRVYLAQRSYAKALGHFSEGLQLWPNNAVARYLAGQAAEGIGDFDRAIAEYRYSIRADAGATDARTRLARLHLAEGEDNLALAALRHNNSTHPPDFEMTLLELQLVGRAGSDGVRLPANLLTRIRSSLIWGQAVAAMAAGTRATAGAVAAAQLVETAEGDLTDPNNAAALRSLVTDLIAIDRADDGLARAEAALRGHPKEGEFYAIRAMAFERTGVSAEKVRSDYETALSLDPKGVHAHVALGRIEAAAGNANAALLHYAQATASDDADLSALREAASWLASSGRYDDAERKLEQLLERSPYDGAASLQLAKLREQRGGGEVVALARRAARFGGGEPAHSMLERLGESSVEGR